MRGKGIAWVASVGLGMLFFAGCGESPVQPQPLTEELVYEVAPWSVSVTMSGACPAEAIADFRVLHGTCETALAPVVLRDGRTITVRVPVEKVGEICSLVPRPQSFSVSLGTDLEPGTYRLLIPSEVIEADVTFEYESGCL